MTLQVEFFRRIGPMAAAASKFPSHKKVGSSDAEEIKVASVHFLSRSSNATGDPASPGNG